MEGGIARDAESRLTGRRVGRVETDADAETRAEGGVVIDLTRIPPVIDPNIDPNLAAAVRRAPAHVHVIFAGPDAPFLDALRAIYGVPLPHPDVFICTHSRRKILVCAGTPTG